MTCLNCYDNIRKTYGFDVKIGYYYYTGTNNTCCPVKCKILDIKNDYVTYQTKDGVTHSKKYIDFIKSSWRDKLNEPF